MINHFIEQKKILQILSLQEQIVEINNMITFLANKKNKANIKDNRYERIKELKHIKDNLKIKIYA